MNSIFPSRLKQARLMRGLSMDALSDRANNALTKQSISKYETGRMMPDSKSLIILANALDINVDYFFRFHSVSIERIEFRNKKKLGIKEMNIIKEMVKDRLERYLELESITNVGSDFNYLFDNFIIQNEGDVNIIISKIKKDWKLGEDGINNLIETLEENNIKVIEIDSFDGFDGLSGYANGRQPIIVMNQKLGSERKRFTALHELGHLLLNFDESLSNRDREHFCNYFASEMLISSEEFIKRIGVKRKDISLPELRDIQIQFGISLYDLMHKAKDLKIIPENRFKSFCMKMKDPQFKEQLVENRYHDERSNRFERLVYRALSSEIISLSKASALLNQPINKVLDQLNLL